MFGQFVVFVSFCCLGFAIQINENGRIGSIKPGQDDPAESALQDLSKVANTLGKVAEAFGELIPKINPVANILSKILGFLAKLIGINLGGESPEMKLMKHEFGEINMKLDTMTQDLDLIKDLIVETSLKAAYISDENAILNGFQILDKFVNELRNITCGIPEDCIKQKTRLGEKYLPHFDISQNMENIYRGAMDRTTVFSEPLLDQINKTYHCDVPKIIRFADGILKLSFKEQQVTMVYNMITDSNYSIAKTLNSWMKHMYKLEDYSKKIIGHCLDNIKSFMLRDIRAAKYQSGYTSNYEAAKAQRKDLVEKYPWLDWVVMAFDTDKDTVCQTYNMDGSFYSLIEDVNKGRRNIISTFFDKGIYRTSIKEEISEKFKDIMLDIRAGSFFYIFGGQLEWTDNLFDKITNKLKEYGIWRYIKGFTMLYKEKNWHYYIDSNHYDRFYEQQFGHFRFFFALKSEEEMMFLKTDEDRASLIRCNLPCKRGQEPCEQCAHGGQCNHYPYSSYFFCECKNYFHGERCEKRSNISMATHLETMFKHTLTLPKLTDIYFEIKDIGSYIGASLSNIQEAIHHLSTTIGKALIQLHESLSKQFKMIGLVTTYGQQIKKLQYYIELFQDVRSFSDTLNNPELVDLAEAVLGSQRYNGIRRWLHDFNILINGTSEFTLTPAEPILITYIDQYKDKACSQEYKDAIDNIWRQLILLQQRGYMIWIQALHILNEPTDFAVRQYEEYTSSQVETLKTKTCSLVVIGSDMLNCTNGYYMNEKIELSVKCKTNYFLVGNETVSCRNIQAACDFCNCSLNGSTSQECEDQTGKCLCKDKYYGDKCENTNCTWSQWGSWSTCPHCGYANQTRNREILRPAVGAGTCYGDSLQTRPCFQGCCSNQFHCNISETCIPENQHCNNRQNCPHNEDELDCCETRYTPWYDNNGGSAWALIRPYIDCGSHFKMIIKFSLEASPYPQNKIRYIYICCRFSTQFCSPRLTNNEATEGNDNLIYLDKQHVDCGSNSVINSFQLVDVSGYGTWYYQYGCCDIDSAFQKSCRTDNSTWTEEASGKNFFLGRQDFQCQKNSYLSYFHLERNSAHTLIRYNYRCCFVY